MSLIEVRDLVVRLGGSTVIEGLSFDVEAGELLCVIGPSGCGKTTLLRALGGLVPPTSGEVRVGGEPAERGWARAACPTGSRPLAASRREKRSRLTETRPWMAAG